MSYCTEVLRSAEEHASSKRVNRAKAHLTVPKCRSMRWVTMNTMNIFFMTAVLQLDVFVLAEMNASSLIPRPQVIVAVGDSYASGNGAGNYESIRDCFRSSTNYGAQMARLLNASTFLNRGCSAGVFADITNDRYIGSVRKGQDGNCPIPSSDAPDEFYIDNVGSATCDHMVQAQIRALDSTVDLVLFAMGANNMQFEALVPRCFLFLFRDARKCQNQLNFVQNNFLEWTQNLSDTLIAMHPFLKPTARVIVLQNPHIVQEVPSYTYNPILGGSVELTNQLRTLGILLDESQRSAISMANEAVNRTFVFYYDQVKSIFAGHESNPRLFVKNPDGWMHESWRRILAEIYHLNQKGHAVLAEALYDYVVPLIM